MISGNMNIHTRGEESALKNLGGEGPQYFGRTPTRVFMLLLKHYVHKTRGWMLTAGGNIFKSYIMYALLLQSGSLFTVQCHKSAA